MYNLAMTTMSATQARAALPEILDRVAAGDEVTITRHGQPVAVVVRVDALRVRRADQARAAAQRLGQLLDRLGEVPLDDAAASPISARRAEELVAELRASREAR